MDNNFHGEYSGGKKFVEDNSDPPKFKKARLIVKVNGITNPDETDNYDTSKSDSLEETVSISSFRNEELKEAPANLCFPTKRFSDNPRHCCHVDSLLRRTEEIFDDMVNVSENEVRNSEMNFDTYFLRWHNRQVIRCDIENKINTILEDCLGDNPHMFVTLGISNIVEEADTEIRNEGILMAIESHGLRTNNNVIGESPHSSSSTSENDSICGSSFTPILEEKSNNPTSVIFTNDRCASTEVSTIPDISLQSGMSKLYQLNSTDFFNTAVSAAIFEKGLSHSNE